MSLEPVLDPPSLLAPSEQILLKGDQFAGEERLGKRVELININVAVDARELGEAMVAAAFLAKVALLALLLFPQ
jgi:hypothetical protein